MNNNLQLIFHDSNFKKKKELEGSISRKRNKLSRLQSKLKELTHEINHVKEEYETRIGKLYAKDNQLDIEIIRYRNIFKLMQEGFSQEVAVKEIDGFCEQIFDHMPFDSETSQLEFKEFDKNDGDQNFKMNIKKLWKKLLFQFHPDLVTNTKEKFRREQIVKEINKAYKSENYDNLKLLESQWYIEEFQTDSVDQLEFVLIEIENVIIALEKQYKNLKTSQWYRWKILKEKKGSTDIFAELEKSLLDDIICKNKILNTLKGNIDKNNNSF